MTRILIRAGKDPRTVLSPEQALATSRLGVFGSNSGNMLFYSAVHRALSTPGTELVANSYIHERPQCRDEHIERINDEFDHFVLPMANSYRESFLPHLERLTGVIDRLTVPVTVIGIGAQLEYGTSFSTLPDEYTRTVRRFTTAVLEHSESIGVRGEYTAAMLEHLGVATERIRIIGCPSMYTSGPCGPLVRKRERLDVDSRLALSYTPGVPGMAALIDHNTTAYPRSIVIPQEHDQLALMLWGEDPGPNTDRSLPAHAGHRLFRTDRLRFFIDASTWIRYMARRDFVFGTRIHGNIAAVLAGTPAMVLAHDSRTAELAQFHGIPFQLFRDLPADIDAQQLYESADIESFTARQATTFAAYTAFLEDNNLQHVFQSQNANPEYDRTLADAPFPGPVHPLTAPGETGREAVMGRLRWLRQGATGDFARTEYAFDRPFVGAREVPSTRLTANQVRDLRIEVDRLRCRVNALEKRPLPVPLRVRLRRRAGWVLRRLGLRPTTAPQDRRSPQEERS